MKVGVASDLHLDFADMNPEFFQWRGDLLLLAGDLGEEDYLRKHGAEFFDGVSKMAEQVFVISGNHEFYGSELDVAEDHLDVYLEQWKNIIPLRNEVKSFGHLDVFGGTLWTDYHGSPIAEMAAFMGLNDFKQIRIKKAGYRKITPRDILIEHMKGKNKLLDFLEKPSGGIKLVMTHHAPSMQSVPNRFRADYDLNKAYCNHFDALIESFPDLSYWVHGHTHDYINYTIGQTEVICNPRGYPAERPAHLPPYQPRDILL
ncbi:metallophosphoesterase [Xanthomonas phage X1]|nr:metallophosphoesterase [Xanthomonas phage X1]